MALRFPKNVYSDTFRGLPGLMNASAGSQVQAVWQNNCACLVAPARYSNVKKVVASFVTGKTGPGTTMDGRMRLGTWSSTTPGLAVEKFNLPNSAVIENAPDSGFVGTNRHRFTDEGDLTTILQANVSTLEHDRAQIIQIEFSRSDPAANDFYQAWDAFDDDDDYMVLHPYIDVDSHDAGGDFTMRFSLMQVTVVQAPGNTNDSNADFGIFTGTIDIAEATTAFLGPVSSARHVFHYVAADWDGIDNASVIYYGARSGGSALNIRLRDQTAGADVFTEAIGLSANLNYVARSQDFKAALIDGHVYSCEHTITGAAGVTNPRGCGFISIVQKTLTKTVCVHNIPALDAQPTVGTDDESSVHAILFDPLWYEDFTDAQILSRKLFSQIIHNAAANSPRMAIRVDSDLLSDDSARASATAVDMSPEHTLTGAPTTIASLLFDDIIAPDPIALTGQQKLTKSFPTGSTWHNVAVDFPGGMGLYYALDVPSSAEAEDPAANVAVSAQTAGTATGELLRGSRGFTFNARLF